MAREYSITLSGATTTTGVTLGQNGPVTLISMCNKSAGPAPELLRHWVGQAANATSAQQRIRLQTQVTTFGTGAAATVNKLKSSDPASGWSGSTAAGTQGSATVNYTAEAANETPIWEDAFNVLNGFLKVNTPVETEVLSSSATATVIALKFPTVPGTTTGWSFGWVFREVG